MLNRFYCYKNKGNMISLDTVLTVKLQQMGVGLANILESAGRFSVRCAGMPVFLSTFCHHFLVMPNLSFSLSSSFSICFPGSHLEKHSAEQRGPVPPDSHLRRSRGVGGSGWGGGLARVP